MILRRMWGVDGSYVEFDDGITDHRPVEIPPYRWWEQPRSEHMSEDGTTNEQSSEQTHPQAALSDPVKSIALQTVEEIVETITHTQTPAASAGVLIEWTAGILKNALGLASQGNFGATKDAITQHIADLEENKETLAQAVAS